MFIEGIDLFCGAGGTTSGVHRARFKGERIARIIACINHDPKAIKSHAANHRQTKHFIEDIRNFDVSRFPTWTPGAITFLWASLECTNHSNAKGGLSRDEDSRTLGVHLYRYIEYLKPDYIPIENVREFLEWGPLIVKEKKTKEGYLVSLLHYNKKEKKLKPVMAPDPLHKGEYYKEWVQKIKSYGYDYDYRILNAADYGEHTHRKRLFIMFAKHGFPLAECWPEPTHSKKGGGLFKLKKWKPVKECLDFEDHGESIFAKGLCENTLKRIYAGLIKYVAGGEDAFIQQYNSGSDSNRVISLNNPCNAIPTRNRFGLVQPDFLMKYYGTGKNVQSIQEPAGTVRTKDTFAKIATEYFIDLQYSKGQKNHPIDKPCSSILTNPKQRLVKVEQLSFIDETYGKSKCASVEKPAGSMTTNPKQNLITAEPWLMDTPFNNTGSSIGESGQVITANRKYHYLMNPQYKNKGGDVNDPCFTLIARMDKRPPHLITTEAGYVAIKINETDSAMTRKIKEFMALYGIIDIKMRMLKVKELLKIQGFGEKYKLYGTQSDMKKFIGNAVCPLAVKRWIESIYKANIEFKQIMEAA